MKHASNSSTFHTKMSCMHVYFASISHKNVYFACTSISRVHFSMPRAIATSCTTSLYHSLKPQTTYTYMTTTKVFFLFFSLTYRQVLCNFARSTDAIRRIACQTLTHASIDQLIHYIEACCGFIASVYS